MITFEVIWSVNTVSILILVTMATSEHVNLSSEEIAAVETVTHGTNKFAVSLYRALTRSKEGNVFVSPLSVQMVLALAYTGAKGDTATEIAKALVLPDKLENTYAGYNALIRLLKDPVLKLVNRMFVEATQKVKQEFQSNAEKYFLSSAESVDFKEAAEKVRTHINAWVEEQTNKKIINLLAPGVVSSDTKLVLVNAIHFKANWKHKFEKRHTKEEPFHVSKTKSVPVQMMHAKKKFGFKHDSDLKAKILEMVYEGLNFRMLVILPDDIEGLAELESKLDNVDLSDKVKYMEETTVTVALPKFKMEESMELNNILKSLGMQTMFSAEKADFSKLADVPLCVSAVVQKAFVEVNEEGTEAAAATAMLIRKKRGMPDEDDPLEFIADHPFLFILSNNPSSSSWSILFFGRCTLPKSLPSETAKTRDEL